VTKFKRLETTAVNLNDKERNLGTVIHDTGLKSGLKSLCRVHYLETAINGNCICEEVKFEEMLKLAFVVLSDKKTDSLLSWSKYVFQKRTLRIVYTLFALMSIDCRHECNTNILNRIRRYLYRQFSKISSHLSIMSDYGLDDRSIEVRFPV
jgi:hypothetical protein